MQSSFTNRILPTQPFPQILSSAPIGHRYRHQARLPKTKKSTGPYKTAVSTMEIPVCCPPQGGVSASLTVTVVGTDCSYFTSIELYIFIINTTKGIVPRYSGIRRGILRLSVFSIPPQSVPDSPRTSRTNHRRLVQKVLRRQISTSRKQTPH